MKVTTERQAESRAPRGRNIAGGPTSLLVCVLSAIACGGGAERLVGEPDDVTPVTITIAPALVTIEQGASELLAVTIAGGNAASMPTLVSCSSASNSIVRASIHGGGCRLDAVGPGSTTVTATARTGQQASAGATVTAKSVTLGVGFGLEQFAMVYSGSFQRGRSNGRSDEQPVRTISISEFRLQKTEVTQGQWRQVMAGTALANPGGFTNCGDTCPVDGFSWEEIQQFLARLNQQDPGKGYRLPTEAEWEYAARAGTTGDVNVAGQTLDAVAWVSWNSQSRMWPVAQKLGNAWGLFDMLGNVSEWVNDWYQSTYYPASAATDPIGPTDGLSRVWRGGSYRGGSDAHPAYRGWSAPFAKAAGFRLARTR